MALASTGQSEKCTETSCKKSRANLMDELKEKVPGYGKSMKLDLSSAGSGFPLPAANSLSVRS